MKMKKISREINKLIGENQKLDENGDFFDVYVLKTYFSVSVLNEKILCNISRKSVQNRQKKLFLTNRKITCLTLSNDFWIIL